MIFAKAIFMFLGILFTFVNIARLYKGQAISTSNFALQAIGWTGFIILQWVM